MCQGLRRYYLSFLLPCLLDACARETIKMYWLQCAPSSHCCSILNHCDHAFSFYSDTDHRCENTIWISNILCYAHCEKWDKYLETEIFRVSADDSDALDILMPFIPRQFYHLLVEYNIKFLQKLYSPSTAMGHECSMRWRKNDRIKIYLLDSHWNNFWEMRHES